jgi:hypothetical protein
LRTRYLVFCLFLISSAAIGIFAQDFPQMRQMEERRREMVKADEEEHNQGKTPAKAPASPRPVTNVDVQMVLTRNEYKSFAEAKPNAVSTFADGDPAWLYVKFNGKLERYVRRLPDGNGGERCVLFFEYGPAGDITAKSHETVEFSKAELGQSELKFSLSPGRAGHNKALAIYIKNVAVSKPGLWHNELRLTDSNGFPRSQTDYLAKTAFNSDFGKGVSKYPLARTAFQSMVLRDNTDEAKLPIAGHFDDNAARTDLAIRLSAESITPVKVYFADDFWSEYSDNPTSVRQFRTATATFLYRSGAACMYGTADITQEFQPMDNRFGPSKITLKKDLPVACTEFK